MTESSKGIIEENRQKLDRYFKKFISRTDVLTNILHGYVDEYKDMDPDEIRRYLPKVPSESYVRMESIAPGNDSESTRQDALFRIGLPDSDEKIAIYLNIEGQNQFFPPYPLVNRAEAYMSDLIAYQRGREYVKSHYESIKKVYSIWLLFEPPGWLANSIVRYDRTPSVVFGSIDVNRIPKMDLTHIIMVNLGSYHDDLPENLALVTALFSAGLDADRRFGTLEDRFKISFDDEERREVEEMLSLYDSFEENHINYGNHRYEEGRIEGRVEGMIELVTNMISKGMSVDDALDFIDEDDETKEKIRNAVLGAMKDHDPQRMDLDD